MRVLLVHNYTGKYAKGGEGNVFEDEADLLRAHGHDVRQYKCTNAEIMEGSLLQKLRAFINAPWSQYGYRVIREQIEEFKPDIIHIHNFFFILSPSVFRAAKDAGVPVVVTLHNYRFICPCSQLLRNGRICELCINKNPWRIMLYRCYRNSFWASLFRYLVYYLSKKKYGWLDDIDGFIALTEFAKHKYVQAGLPGERIYVKPNFIADPLSNNSFSENQKEYGLFAGRISPEKGLDNLLQGVPGTGLEGTGVFELFTVPFDLL